MKLGIVIGAVWASRKTPELLGCRLSIVQPVSSDLQANDLPLVAADPLNLATGGDTVVYVTSTDATQAFANGFAPVNASIVELVERID
jgi:ethanolamine utilization protein EutN